MKDWRMWAVLAGLGALVLYWRSKNPPMPPSGPTGAVSTDGNVIDIASLKTGTGQGLDSQQTLDVFQGLFGILNASDKLDQLRNTVVKENWTVKARSTALGGWSTTKIASGAAWGANDINTPLAAPWYFLTRLGITAG
jgi:hypothetical protein